MGQRELLLIVLGVIVVMMVVVVGINFFDAANNQQKDYTDGGNGIMTIADTDQEAINNSLKEWQETFPQKTIIYKRLIAAGELPDSYASFYLVIYKEGVPSPEH